MRSFLSLRLLLLLASLCGFLAPVQAAVTRMYEQNFPLTAKELIRLHAELVSGSIDIVPEDVTEIRVTIHATYDVETEQEADRLHSNLRIGMQRTGNQVDVTADYGRDQRWTFADWPSVKLTLSIVVPIRSDLDLTTRDGGITVGRMKGAMKAHTRAGTIFFRGVDGSIEAESDYSDIIISHCTGDLKLRCVSGEFRVGPVGGSADVYGHGGEIVASPSCRSLKVETSGADLVVTFRHPVAAASTLRTGGGNIILTLDKRSAASLDLRASLFGKVACVKDSLPLVITNGVLGRSRVTATLNNGGPLIEARANGGSVTVMGEANSD